LAIHLTKSKHQKMRKLLLPIVSFLSFLAANAQTDTVQAEKKSKPFIINVSMNNGGKVKGLFYTINDTQLVLSRSSKIVSGSLPDDQQYSIPAENIKSFTAGRKNSALRGALVGFGVGAVTGIIIGLVSGDDPVAQYPDPSTDFLGIGTFGAALQNSFAMTAGEKAVIGGVGLGVTGAITGAIIGALAKKKFTIGGKRERFRDLQAELMLKLVQN
jgi:hypothetical protein